MSLRSLATLVLLLAGAAAACDDGTTAPAPSLEVSLTAATDSVRVNTRTDGSTEVVCRARFRAVSTGDTGTRARWQGGVFRFYTGADRATAIDSIAFTPEYLTLLLANAPLTPGFDQGTVWQLVQREPFTVQAEFRYKQVGTEFAPRTVTASTECRPQG
ncbi:MAG TPA: hypothetical protein VLK84_06440 [Longimicrobium sp.]|nr:hypothetical protein [Longimicrobium sp.]